MFFTYNNTRGGFTLIELLVVLAVISLLSSIVFASVQESRANAIQTKSIAQGREIQKTIIEYQLTSPGQNKLPVELQNLGDEEALCNTDTSVTEYNSAVQEISTETNFPFSSLSDEYEYCFFRNDLFATFIDDFGAKTFSTDTSVLALSYPPCIDYAFRLNPDSDIYFFIDYIANNTSVCSSGGSGGNR